MKRNVCYMSSGLTPNQSDISLLRSFYHIADSFRLGPKENETVTERAGYHHTVGGEVQEGIYVSVLGKIGIFEAKSQLHQSSMCASGGGGGCIYRIHGAEGEAWHIHSFSPYF